MTIASKRIVDSNPTKVVQFQVIHFRDRIKKEGKNEENGEKELFEEKDVLILYGLGEDGIIYEFTNGKWLPIPITKANTRKPIV